MAGVYEDFNGGADPDGCRDDLLNAITKIGILQVSINTV